MAGDLQLREHFCRARLTVTDITGAASSPVEQTISMAGTAKVAGASNNRLGGALPVSSLLLLSLLAAIRRRR